MTTNHDLGQAPEHRGITARGALFGAGFGLALGLGYLMLTVATIYLGPVIGALLNGEAGSDLSITLEFVIGTALGGVMIVVLPAVVLGALAGLLIGVLRRHSRASWTSRRTWLTGTAVTGALGVLSAGGLAALVAPELLWALPGALFFTVPLLGFGALGGPFATLLADAS